MLKGTEKQVKWAEDIKEVFILTMNAMYWNFTDDPQFDENNETHMAKAESFKENVNTIEAEEYAGDIIEMFASIMDYKDEPAIKRYKAIRAAAVVTGNARAKNYKF